VIAARRKAACTVVEPECQVGDEPVGLLPVALRAAEEGAQVPDGRVVTDAPEIVEDERPIEGVGVGEETQQDGKPGEDPGLPGTPSGLRWRHVHGERERWAGHGPGPQRRSRRSNARDASASAAPA
jgi:hypothetical protein